MKVETQLYLVDQLGLVKAQIADLIKVEKQLVEQIKLDMLVHGETAIEGDVFRATLSVAEVVTVNTTVVKTRFPQASNPDLYSSSVRETLKLSAKTGKP